MQTARKIRNAICLKALSHENGMILVAALTLMATLILVGVTTYIVSSNNLKIEIGRASCRERVC